MTALFFRLCDMSMRLTGIRVSPDAPTLPIAVPASSRISALSSGVVTPVLTVAAVCSPFLYTARVKGRHQPDASRCVSPLAVIYRTFPDREV